jgi:hypothetical protein
MSKYKRKTVDKFYIALQVGFDGQKQILSFNFQTEADCDLKLKELREKVEIAKANPILHPFSLFDHYWKIKKRIRITSLTI